MEMRMKAVQIATLGSVPLGWSGWAMRPQRLPEGRKTKLTPPLRLSSGTKPKWRLSALMA